jgi:SAM-dependent methyltransferase
LFTNPRWSRQEIERIYAEEFMDDPGAPMRSCDNSEIDREKWFQKELDTARTECIPIIRQYIDPQDKKWLDLRFRSGGLLAALHELGAHVSGIDLFEDNARCLKRRIAGPTLHVAPVHDLLAPVNDTVDAVSMLSTHVLSHTPSPLALLQRIREILVCGGLLFVDEKDVTKITANASFPCRYQPGIVHYHHLTLNSTKALIAKAGFEIVHADYSTATALRHFLIVARKPSMPLAMKASDVVADDPTSLYRRMMIMYWQTRYHESTQRLRRGLRRVIGAANSRPLSRRLAARIHWRNQSTN